MCAAKHLSSVSRWSKGPLPPATARLGRKKKKESGHTMPLVRCRGWHQASREGGGSRGHVRARRLSGESALPAHPHFAQADLRYTDTVIARKMNFYLCRIEYTVR